MSATTCPQSRCISIFALYNYAMMQDFEQQLHLVFLVEDYPQFLLNEVNCLLKAESIQKQYVLTDKIRLLHKDFGRKYSIGDSVTLSVREQQIEQKVENIMALDIALLKFIESVPDRIEQNSFKLPQNADVPYLVGEYMSIKEKQIVSKISKALDLYNTAEFSDSFEPIAKLETVVFNNTLYLTRINESELQRLTQNNDDFKHDYRLLVEFCDEFFKSSENRSIAEMRADQIPWKLTNFGVDTQQILIAMASVFSPDNDTYYRLKMFFANNDPTIDQDNSVKSAKRRMLSIRSLRESALYSNKIMILTLYFMFMEENDELLEQAPPAESSELDKSKTKRKRKSSAASSRLPRNVEEYRNQFIIVLNRMIQHLLEYTQFKAASKDYKIRYSQLPIIDMHGLDAKKRPITSLIYVMQYALNFAPFLCSTV